MSSNYISSASYSNKLWATSLKATFDQGYTQIGEVQEIKEGKFLILLRSLSPIGDKQAVICKLNLHLATKCSHKAIPLNDSFYLSFISDSMLSLSSVAYKLGISPIFNKLFMSSKNFSLINYASLIKNTPPLSFITISLNIVLIYSSHSFYPKSASNSISNKVKS